MQRRVEKALVAKVGTFVFAGILGMPATLPPSGAPVSIFADAAAVAPALGVAAPFDVASELAEMRAVARSSPTARGEAFIVASADAAAPEPTPEPAPAAPPPPRVVVLAPVPVPSGGGTVVLASWYGPGFYGERTACGLTLTQQTLGVADLALPCGTMVTLTSPAGRTVTVPVIDRGPYIAGRTLDLTYATKVVLACSDLCSVRMSVP
ncbi:MAG: hypothetical protein KGN00_08040 [Chloroflexota bacterium]|nr:hypothetical protein [Chloroflexota bacterium]